MDFESESFSVGIISLGEAANENLVMVTPMIQQLISRKLYFTIDNQSIKSSQLVQTLLGWTRGNSAKDFIFTLGGVSRKEDVHVLKVTKSVLNPELALVAEKMIAGLSSEANGVHFYQGTVGICLKSIIINLPGKVDAAEHCLQKLEDYVETFIQTVEK